MAARALRNAGYGWMSVALALVLTGRGYSAVAIGTILAVALSTGACYSVMSGWLAERFGGRRTLVIGSFVMVASGVLLAFDSVWLTCLAVVLGTVSAGTQEVGPFTALEQTMIAHVARGANQTTTILGRYNLVGAFAVAVGASIAAVVPPSSALWGYAALGIALAVLYSTFPVIDLSRTRQEEGSQKGPVPRVIVNMSVLFGLDAFGGGILVQSFITYWFVLRFGADARQIGIMFFATNVLGALSLLLAAPASRRFGMVRTMFGSHLPSNVFLLLMPFAPSFGWAAALLLARATVAQIDVPARQSLVMASVPAHERARAVGITNAVRPAASALGPLIAGVAVGIGAGLPFFLCAGVKMLYDVGLMVQFHDLDAKLQSES